MSDVLIKKFGGIKDLLKGAKNILITSHEDPDADAIGSMLALFLSLQKIGLKAVVFSNDELPEYLNFLPSFDCISNGDSLSVDYDLFFCLDYGDFKRLKLPANISEEKIVTIDHHPESNHRGVIKIVEPEISSTSEIIYSLINYLGIEIDKDVATCLLTGILYDTGGLKHAVTSSETLKIVSELLSTGISFDEISRKILTVGKSLMNSKIWAEILSRVSFDEKRKFAFSWISFDDFKKYKVGFSELEGIASLMSTISDASFSLFLIEHEKGKIDGSLRSEPHKGRSVIEIAKALGGGGHSFAAGFKQEGTIEEVLKKVYNFIDSTSY